MEITMSLVITNLNRDFNATVHLASGKRLGICRNADDQLLIRRRRQHSRILTMYDWSLISVYFLHIYEVARNMDSGIVRHQRFFMASSSENTVCALYWKNNTFRFSAKFQIGAVVNVFVCKARVLAKKLVTTNILQILLT